MNLKHTALGLDTGFMAFWLLVVRMWVYYFSTLRLFHHLLNEDKDNYLRVQ